MSQAHVPIVVLTNREENVEFINRALRDVGHMVRCHWIDSIDRVTDALEEYSPELLWLFNDGNPNAIKRVAKCRKQVAPMVPLLVVSENVDEAAIADAMQAGAQDLVSVHQLERLRSVAERELRAFQLERALNKAVLSAAHDRKQLSALKAGAEDAIACSLEGILVEANLAWAKLFGYDDSEAEYALVLVHSGPDWIEKGLMKNTLDNLIAVSVRPLVVVFPPPAIGPPLRLGARPCARRATNARKPASMKWIGWDLMEFDVVEHV